MSRNTANEPMLEMYLYETEQLLDRLEQILIDFESSTEQQGMIAEIFRIMHTIKGNSMMMLYEDIGRLAHAVEDLFDFVRQPDTDTVDYGAVVDLVLSSMDFIKEELKKIESGKAPDGSSAELADTIQAHLESLKFMNPGVNKGSVPNTVANQKYYIQPSGAGEAAAAAVSEEEQQHCYRALLRFDDGCEMENVRAFSVVHNLKSLVEGIAHRPKDIVESDDSVLDIQQNGFEVVFKTAETEELLNGFFGEVAFLKSLELHTISTGEYDALADTFNTGRKAQAVAAPVDEVQPELENEPQERIVQRKPKAPASEPEAESAAQSGKGLGGYISVGVSKVDALIDLIGELVVSESMVVNNPDLRGLELNNFDKSARQHRMIIKELQDVIMSIRMVPLELTFQKMNRIVRDMSKKMNKDVRLEITGADTEVDKSVIEHIGDPLMHIIRNAIDHGIEAQEDREAHGKPAQGLVKLDARQSGGFVYISIKDDGKGLDPEAILDKAEQQDLLAKPRKEYLDREIFQFVFAPGFSTKKAVTEYSGRGVGLDVVTRNLETVGGFVTLDSQPGQGSEFVFKIPLSLAILEGMLMQTGKSTFAVPITSIRESLSVAGRDIIKDPAGNEMVMIRGQAHPVLRLHQAYHLPTEITEIPDGILVLVENDSDGVLLFADAILGEQQLVVKPLPQYLDAVDGLGGCALLGDGRICLILDPAGMTQMNRRR